MSSTTCGSTSDACHNATVRALAAVAVDVTHEPAQCAALGAVVREPVAPASARPRGASPNTSVRSERASSRTRRSCACAPTCCSPRPATLMRTRVLGGVRRRGRRRQRARRRHRLPAGPTARASCGAAREGSRSPTARRASTWSSSARPRSWRGTSATRGCADGGRSTASPSRRGEARRRRRIEALACRPFGGRVRADRAALRDRPRPRPRAAARRRRACCTAAPSCSTRRAPRAKRRSRVGRGRAVRGRATFTAHVLPLRLNRAGRRVLRARARPRAARAARRVAVDGRVRGAAGARRAHGARAARGDLTGGRRPPPPAPTWPRRPRVARALGARPVAQVGGRPRARRRGRARARRRGRGGGRACRAPARVRGRRDELAVGRGPATRARGLIETAWRARVRRAADARRRDRHDHAPVQPAALRGRAPRARGRRRPLTSDPKLVHVEGFTFRRPRTRGARPTRRPRASPSSRTRASCTHVARALLGLDSSRAGAWRPAPLRCSDGVARGGGGELGGGGDGGRSPRPLCTCAPSRATSSAATACRSASTASSSPRAATSSSSPAPPDATAAAPRAAARRGARRLYAEPWEGSRRHLDEQRDLAIAAARRLHRREPRADRATSSRRGCARAGSSRRARSPRPTRARPARRAAAAAAPVHSSDSRHARRRRRRRERLAAHRERARAARSSGCGASARSPPTATTATSRATGTRRSRSRAQIRNGRAICARLLLSGLRDFRGIAGGDRARGVTHRRTRRARGFIGKAH